MLYYFFLAFCLLLPFQFALNPAPGIDLAVVRVIIPALSLWLCYDLFKNKKMAEFSDRTTFFLLSLLALSVFSLLFSQNLAWSLRKLAFLFSIAPVYFIAIHACDLPRKIRAALSFLVLGATAVATVGIFQFFSQFIFGIEKTYSFLANSIIPFFLGKSFSAEVLAYPSWLVNSGGTTYMRAFAIFPDPHMFSYYMGMLLPWSLALCATTKNHKGLFFFSSAALAMADVLSFTRGGYIALIVSAVLVLPLVPKTAAKKILIGAAAAVFVLVVSPSSPVTERLGSSFDVNEGSNQARLNNWQQALAVIRNNPLGTGIGTYSLAVDPAASYREPIYAHNLYLDIAAELGIFTVFIFLALLGLSLKNFWKAARSNSFYAAGFASLVVFSTHSLVENPMYSVHILPLFFIVIALSVSINNYAKNIQS